MSMNLSEDRYEEITANAETQALGGIWGQLSYDTPVFSCQRELFLWILDRLLREKRIRLHKNGVFLECDVDEQVDAMRKAWPSSVEASGYQDFWWWFFDEECPAGVAWRLADGTYAIAD